MRLLQTRCASRLLNTSAFRATSISRRSLTEDHGIATDSESKRDSEVSTSTASYSLESKMEAYNLRDRRKAAAMKGAATRLARRQAAELSVLLPPRVGAAAMEPHTDLESYLEYVERDGVKTTTTVYKGTVYEYTVAEALKQYDMELRRVGKAGDHGIDLIGTWTLPDGRVVRVFVQCKLTKTMPAFIRELEGAYTGAPAGWDNDEVLGVLATRHSATAGAQQAIQRSKLPLGIAQIDVDGSIKQFVWNQVANDAGLAEVGVTSRHGTVGAAGSDQVNQVALTWQSRNWPTDR